MAAASAHCALVAWAMAWSASCRFVRVRLTGLWSLVSTSGKVTWAVSRFGARDDRRRPSRARRAAVMGHCAGIAF